MQRYLIIGAGVVVVVGLAIVGYFLYLAGNVSLSTVSTSGSSTPLTGNPGSGGTQGGGAGSAPVPAPALTRIGQRLTQIDQNVTVPGEAVFDITRASGTGTSSPKVPDVQINYLERASGNVFSFLVHAATITRINNRTIPGIQEADWVPNGSKAFVRYLSGTDNSTINTYALNASGSGGFFLPEDITGIAVASTSLVSVASGDNGSIISLTHTDGTGATQIFSTALSALRVSFAGKSIYLAFTKPASALAGYAYIADSAGNFTRIAGPLNGLVALASPLGDYALVSYSSAGVLSMELVNTKTGQATQLPVATIADKCVWAASEDAVYCGIPTAPSAQFAYPDDWYQGALFFSDKIWKISVAGRYAQLVLDFPAQARGSLDAINLAIDPSETVLAFRNKIDGSLWAYQL